MSKSQVAMKKQKKICTDLFYIFKSTSILAIIFFIANILPAPTCLGQQSNKIGVRSEKILNKSFSSVYKEKILPANQKQSLKSNAQTNINATSLLTPSKFYVPNNLLITVDGNIYSDGLVVNFNNGATNGYDQDYDVLKFMGLSDAPQIGTLWYGFWLSINVVPEITQYTVMPMTFDCKASGTFILTAQGTTTFSPTLSIRLRDLVADTIINLRTDSVYSFSHTYDSTASNIRFNILFGDSLTTGIKENTSSLNIYSYRNHIYFENPSLIKLAQITIYNNLGQIVRIINAPESATLFQINADFSPGVYIINTIDLEGNRFAKKVSIQN